MSAHPESDPQAPADDYGNAALAPDRLRELSKRSNSRGLVHLYAHLALIAVTGYLVWLTRHSAWLWPAMFAHGVGLVFLFAPLHESIHRTAFRSRWLNETVAWVCGLVVLLPPTLFRAFHFAHHRFTQDPARDPELAIKNVNTVTGYLLYITGVNYWRRSVEGLVNGALDRLDADYCPERLEARVVRECRIMLAIYGGVAVTVAMGLNAALILWVVPMVLAQPLVRGWLLAEHTGCELSADMYRNTRTTYTNALTRFLIWNMSYHVEHHAYPGVPFHALARLNREIRTRFTVQAHGYLRVNRDWLVQLIGLRPSPDQSS